MTLSAEDYLGQPDLPSADEFLDGKPSTLSGKSIIAQTLQPSAYLSNVIVKAFGHDKPADPNLGLSTDAVNAMKSSGEWNDYVKDHADHSQALVNGVIKPSASDMQAGFIKGSMSPFTPIVNDSVEALKNAFTATGAAVSEPYDEKNIPALMTPADIAV